MGYKFNKLLVCIIFEMIIIEFIFENSKQCSGYVTIFPMLCITFIIKKSNSFQAYFIRCPNKQLAPDTECHKQQYYCLGLFFTAQSSSQVYIENVLIIDLNPGLHLNLPRQLMNMKKRYLKLAKMYTVLRCTSPCCIVCKSNPNYMSFVR